MNNTPADNQHISATDLQENPPVIGISMYDANRKGCYTMPKEYVTAVRLGGGIPVCIPPEEANLPALLASLDGVIISGGGDIAPAFYNGQPHETIYGVSEQRDKSELTLTELLLLNQIPTLGICRGLQIIVSQLGGTLHPHIPDVQAYTITHRHPDETLEKRTVIHDVTLTATSKLAEMVGSIHFPVVSWHHQAVKDLPRGFQAVAVAEDGLVEAMESKEYPNLIAVQWHPELSVETDAIQLKLFRSFVQLCQQNSLSRMA